MRADDIITATKQIPTSHVCSTDERKLKEFPVNKKLSQICSRDEDESKGIIINDNLLHICSTDKDE